MEITHWNNTLQTTLATAESTSRKQGDQIRELEQTVTQLKAAKLAAEEEAKKEKAATMEAKCVMDEAKRAMEMAMIAEDEAKKAVEETKKVLLATEESKNNLEARVDCIEARAKMVEDLLSKEQADLAQKLADREDKLVDTTLFRVWSMNQDIDLSFLEGELEKTLARWKVRLEEDKILTFSEAAARDEASRDFTVEVAEQTDVVAAA